MSEYYYKKIEAGLIDPPEETPEILAEQQQIWDYMPLVKKTAHGLSFLCNLGYLDICQQGYYILAELTTKIDWLEVDRKMISRYVKLSVEGLLKNYCSKYSTVVSAPRGGNGIETVALEEAEELKGEALNPEEELLLRQRNAKVRLVVALVSTLLNERESFILWSCLIPDGEPMSYSEVARQFNCHKSSVGRDALKILQLLKETYNEYTKT
jgi:hypothetical protein